jgi:hypothetical protein
LGLIAGNEERDIPSLEMAIFVLLWMQRTWSNKPAAILSWLRVLQERPLDFQQNLKVLEQGALLLSRPRQKKCTLWSGIVHFGQI